MRIEFDYFLQRWQNTVRHRHGLKLLKSSVELENGSLKTLSLKVFVGGEEFDQVGLSKTVKPNPSFHWLRKFELISLAERSQNVCATHEHDGKCAFQNFAKNDLRELRAALSSGQ